MTTDAPQFDAMILGDSHAVALKAGCDRLGLRTAMLSLSGNFWHGRLIGLHQSRGLVARGGVQPRVNAFKTRYGLSMVPHPGIPVIASFGFQLGRMVPMFGVDGHKCVETDFLQDDAAQYVSRALLQHYVESFRRHHVNLLRRMARQVPTVLVVPPQMSSDGNMVAFKNEILAMMRASGLNIVDPCAELFADGGVLPQNLRADDGHHGNDEYGTQSIKLVAQTGFLELPESAQTSAQNDV
jgi:hypothetical protein